MTSKEKIILLGGGGHARVVLSLIMASHKFVPVGILDPDLRPGERVAGISVLGGDDYLPKLRKEKIRRFCVAVGSLGKSDRRRILYEKAVEHGLEAPPLVHPTARLADETVQISPGAQIMMGAIIQTGAVIGENSIVNTGVSIDHDCSIGKHAHLAPGAVLCGTVAVGDEAFIGAGSIVIQNISIGPKAFVGAGSLVTRDVPASGHFKRTTSC